VEACNDGTERGSVRCLFHGCRFDRYNDYHQGEKMNRRDFVKGTVTASVIAPFIAVGKIVELSKERKEPLQPLPNGSVLTSEYFAEVVNRINELETRV